MHPLRCSLPIGGASTCERGEHKAGEQELWRRLCRETCHEGGYSAATRTISFYITVLRWWNSHEWHKVQTSNHLTISILSTISPGVHIIGGLTRGRRPWHAGPWPSRSGSRWRASRKWSHTAYDYKLQNPNDLTISILSTQECTS
jgi:hypothetical protein